MTQRNIFSYFKPPDTAATSGVELSMETTPSTRTSKHHASPPREFGSSSSSEPEPNAADVEARETETEESDALRDESDYELLRQVNMKRNADFLKQLGLHDMKSTLNTTSQSRQSNKKIRVSKKPCEDFVPMRRSARLIANPVSYSEEESECKETGRAGDFRENESTQYDTFYESDVLRYVLSDRANGATSCLMPENNLTGGQTKDFRMRLSGATGGEDNNVLRCNDISAVYSMHIHPSIPSLLLAAGKGGQVVLYRLGHSVEHVLPIEDSTENNVLMSFRAHSKWIGAAKLITKNDSSEIFVATCSEDASVKIWCVSVSASVKYASKEESNLKHPLLVCESKDIHTKGVYCMDVVGETRMITGSKDRSVVYSEIQLPMGRWKEHHPIQSSALIRQISSFPLHGGFVKSVAWQGGTKSEGLNIFAAGGADNCVSIKDVRSGASRADIVIEDVYEHGGVHTVSWSPELDQSSHMLLTAGFTDSIRLFDIRAVGTPLFEYKGHCTGLRSSKNVLQTPSFISGRYCIAAPGAGSSGRTISIYSTITGKCLSRGEIEEEVNSIYSPPCISGAIQAGTDKLFAASKKGAIFPLDILVNIDPE